MNEFNLIQQYFSGKSFPRKDVILGIGDDAAITQVPENQCLVTTTDTLIEDVHFLKGTSAADIAYKTIAVNLSDLAAMGAEPAWLNLSLSMPSVDKLWLTEFSDMVAELCEYYSVQLIGGDTVKGQLSLTLTAQGFVPQESILKRSGAQNGDWIYVTGTLGDAGAGLDILKGKLTINDKEAREYLVNRHLRPAPRVLAGTCLRRIASACIDLSDGLLQDVAHISNTSDTGILLQLDKLPISPALGKNVDSLEKALEYATTSGDDYELLFTVPEEQKTSMQTTLDSYSIQYTCIGQVTGAAGKLDLLLNNQAYDLSSETRHGYQHF
ncbi:thiamine-phosphate kinase [Glaciecola petra]|uniref:Thiamine-monophosphate kinase n=1 Tax=Glaciecola petra TaxID=3075602 RepID=A0ABU2ZT11_9ALTE|nr:thiamine-phosphate kinase [Aestuariibacter sp. P117]MDT0595782.1 thiamine-phosphate kinase [Aestuariibacter sp. P117]